jgi:hypothetical protein
MHGPKDFVARETHQYALSNLQYVIVLTIIPRAHDISAPNPDRST